MKPGRIIMDGASLELSYSGLVPIQDRDRVLEITELLTDRNKRRNNHANSLMQEVCSQADMHGKFLMLMPEAFGTGGLSTAQLVEWYCRRFGFVILQTTPKIILIRVPVDLAEQRASAHEH